MNIVTAVQPGREVAVAVHSVTEKLSIIIPVLNEAANLRAQLAQLQLYRQASHEVIVVDGGSSDGTIDQISSLVDIVTVCERGRARQMNAGAALAGNDVFLFLHVDTLLPPSGCELILNAISRGDIWGRFDVRLSGKQFLLRWIEMAMNCRSRLTGIATGDQAIFMTRDAFTLVGGFGELPLMEDVAISKSLCRLQRPVCFRERVLTSSRHWERRGIMRTVVLMWGLRLAYFLGVDPGKLAQWYYPAESR